MQKVKRTLFVIEYGTCPASSRCCGCFKQTLKKDNLSLMSEIYCRSAPERVNGDIELPELKNKFPSTQQLGKQNGGQKQNGGYKQRHLKSRNKCPHVNNFIEEPHKCALRTPIGPLGTQCKCNTHYLNILNQSEYELADDASKVDKKKNSKCALRSPIGPVSACKCTTHYLNMLNQSEYELADDASKVEKIENANFDEFEFADDAISLNGEISERPNSRTSMKSENPFIQVNGKEELPSPEQIKEQISIKTDVSNNVDKLEIEMKEDDDFDGNCNRLNVPQAQGRGVRQCATLPKRRRNHVNHRMWYRPVLQPPHRQTPDGTDIYYWCDMPKRNDHGKIIR